MIKSIKILLQLHVTLCKYILHIQYYHLPLFLKLLMKYYNAVNDKVGNTFVSDKWVIIIT